ncbi:MAG: MBL fold metallo-hydrolase [Bacteroidales bacterium]|nr:MBL fold metallo-hydrolase [Bacteroidales bacterium]
MKSCIRPVLYGCFFLMYSFSGNALFSQELQIDPHLVRKVAPGFFVHMVNGSLVTFFTGEDGLMVIDPAPEADSIRTDTTLLTAFNLPVRYIVYSHSHFDQIGAGKYYKREGRTVTIAHLNARNEMMSVWEAPEVFNIPPVAPRPSDQLPDMCFTDSMEIQFNGETVTLYHTPEAHTMGDIVIYFRNSNVICTGDLFVFRSGFSPYEGSFRGVIQALDQIIKLCDFQTVIIPGQGSVTNLVGLVEYRNNLLKVVEKVVRLKDKGKTYEQIVAMEPLADLQTGTRFFPDNMIIYCIYYGKWE